MWGYMTREDKQQFTLRISQANSTQLVVKLKRFAEENATVLTYEGIKDHIRNSYLKNQQKYHFFRPFHSIHPLNEHLKEILESLEEERSQRIQKIKGGKSRE